VLQFYGMSYRDDLSRVSPTFLQLLMLVYDTHSSVFINSIGLDYYDVLMMMFQ